MIYNMYLDKFKKQLKAGILAETAGGKNPYFATGAVLQAVLNGFGELDITVQNSL